MEHDGKGKERLKNPQPHKLKVHMAAIMSGYHGAPTLMVPGGRCWCTDLQGPDNGVPESGSAKGSANRALVPLWVAMVSAAEGELTCEPLW